MSATPCASMRSSTATSLVIALSLQPEAEPSDAAASF
jgi:hypothetical protein